MAKILVVDDSNDLLEMFSILLSVKGFEVETASSRNTLENKLSTFVPDLIILDVILHGEDGRKLCKEIKEKNFTKDIPIILVSGNPGLLKEYKEFNADDFIEKPFELSTVMTRINNILKIKEPS